MRKAVYNRLNHRRFELINKKFTVGLSPKERRLFEYLQRFTAAIVSDWHPMNWRYLMETQYQLKKMVRKLYPKGSKHPGVEAVMRRELIRCATKE